MDTVDEELKIVAEKLYELTAPKCQFDCRAPRSCCSEEYCEMAMTISQKEWGVELKPTGHPKLPMMGPRGCIAPPHVRPLCTVHICENTLLRSSGRYKDKYWKLRARLNDLYARKMERSQV